MLRRLLHSVASDDARERMVREQIAGRGIRDPRVIEALREVPRHCFIPEPERPRAYDDGPVAIGQGQTISQPYIVALMTELLRAQPGDRVLEVGTGSGYQAAVLARLVGHVYTIELEERLASAAAALLGELKYENITVRTGDGYAGWPEHAPFDIVIVTAAPEQIPQPLIEQLRAGGRLIVPVGPRFTVQQLLLIEKDATGAIRTQDIAPVMFVPLRRP
ncbi:MAG TPA: protein-L-isoaspartate(D-aspartate) O-methyltransferase [Steroidobacteraceae bacterium]|nr:protein-L-isoaspartate(D-aspartate) O-methyltransferase [Steroidobacteraceae bacterium]